MSHLLTLKDVAMALAVHEKTARMIVRMSIPHVRVGSSIRVTPEALEKYVRGNTKRPLEAIV